MPGDMAAGMPSVWLKDPPFPSLRLAIDIFGFDVERHSILVASYDTPHVCRFVPQFHP